MNEDDEKSAPRSAFDDRFRGSAMRRKYTRPKTMRESKSRKPPTCGACGGAHYTRYCTMGK